MKAVTRTGLTLFAASILVGTAVAAPVAEGGRKFTVELTGAQEVPPADPDGSGTAQIYVNVGQQRVCWDISVEDIADPTRAHIHKAPAGTNGSIVVTLFETGNVDFEGCTTSPLDRELLRDILQNPQGYYVNVHNAEYPGGAIRGQMAK